jgi:hypothetical protein
VLDELAPTAAHVTEQYGNNRIEADHSRLKAWLRPMRGLNRFRSAARIAAGHAFVQNLCRGHYELATDVSPPLRLGDSSASSHWPCDSASPDPTPAPSRRTQQTLGSAVALVTGPKAINSVAAWGSRMRWRPEQARRCRPRRPSRVLRST